MSLISNSNLSYITSTHAHITDWFASVPTISINTRFYVLFKIIARM